MGIGCTAVPSRPVSWLFAHPTVLTSLWHHSRARAVHGIRDNVCADVDFFKELDADSDGRVTLDDLKECLAKNNLPEDYAVQFINRARGAKWWASSITCALTHPTAAWYVR